MDDLRHGISKREYIDEVNRVQAHHTKQMLTRQVLYEVNQ